MKVDMPLNKQTIKSECVCVQAEAKNKCEIIYLRILRNVNVYLI